MNTYAFNNHDQRTAWQSSPVLQSRDYVHKHLCAVQSLSNTQQQQDWDLQLRSLAEQGATQGDYSKAIALLTEIIESYPNSATDYNNRGLMYFRNGQFTEALRDYNQALEINPRLDSAYNNRANYHASQGNLAAAITDYEVALDFNPGNLRAWINQGITFREMGLYDLAIENFDLALVLGRRLKGKIYAERGYAYHLRGDWNCAIADYHRALKLLPTSTKLSAYKQRVESWLNQLLNPISA